MATNSDLRRVADNLRVLSASMVEKAKSGHPGGAMGGADFMAVLYGEFLRYDPSRMDYPYRDRFFLDPGHMSPLLYATLALAGYYSPEDLQSLRQWGSVTPGHPEVDVLRGVENTSGPLGQGHAMALGAAIAEARPGWGPVCGVDVIPAELRGEIHNASACVQALGRKIGAVAANLTKIVEGWITGIGPFVGIGNRRTAVIWEQLDHAASPPFSLFYVCRHFVDTALKESLLFCGF